MDFEFHYTKEQERCREEVRAFIEENAFKEPVVTADPLKLTPELYKEGRELERKLGAKGWYAPGYPKEYGGGGLEIEQCVILAEEIARIEEERRWAGRSEVYSIQTSGIMMHGTEEQKQRFLPPILRGDWAGWQCFTEPDAGTDEASMKSTADRDGDVYIINGTKVFVGLTPVLIYDEIYLYWPAVTDRKAPRHQNISAFFIPGDLPGINYLPQNLIAAPGRKWQVICENVRCPADRLIGEENKGWLVTQATLAAEHGGGGSAIPRNRMVLRFIEYCQKTLRNGQPISRDPMIQDILVKIYIEYNVGRLWGLRNYAMSQGQIPRVRYTGTQTALHGKLNASQLEGALVDILGPYCLIDDPELRVLAGEIENRVRMSELSHVGGTPEVQKIMMSRALGLGRGGTRAAPPKR